MEEWTASSIGAAEGGYDALSTGETPRSTVAFRIHKTTKLHIYVALAICGFLW